LAEKIRRLRPVVEKHQASWFEALTALALEIARDQRVEVLCCETGLGGRLDATNALPALATLLVTVSLDHCRILGKSVSEIAAEKLGLLKPSVPLFCGVHEDLRPQVFQAAVSARSPCYFLDELARIEDRRNSWRLLLRDRVIENLPHPSGPFLQRNMALALLCLEELAAKSILRPIPDPAAALETLFLPGRFQQVLRCPDWIFDTAHNTESLCVSLGAFLARSCSGRRFVLFGCLRDKELGAEIAPWLCRCDGVIAAPIALRRSRNPAELRALLEEWGFPDEKLLGVTANLRDALSRIVREVAPEDAVLVTGSCFLVAEALYQLGMRDLEQTRSPTAAAGILKPFFGEETHAG
jgi:folylpolyglutamate synthase/dihydrofolate synthase